MSPAIACQDLAVGYELGRGQVHTVLDHVNARIPAGRFVCMLGRNGIGKSTLLRTMAKMQPPLGGSVEIDGVDVATLSRLELAQRMAVVLTDRVEVGRLTVFDLVCLGRYPRTGWRGRLETDDRTIVMRSIEAVGIEELATRDISELSDGERQRTMIARALAQEPNILLLDEPTAFLDVLSRVEITALLANLARDAGVAVLLSTHDIELAMRAADLLLLVLPEGTLRIGAPEDCILDGSVGEAFRAQNLEFDPVSARFDVVRRQIGRASVRGGDGLANTLTRRALERIGYVVVDGDDMGGDVVVDVTQHGGAPRWTWTIAGKQSTVDTIEDLVDSLREMG